MFRDTPAYSGFAVDDIDKARDFYADTLGVRVNQDDMGFLQLELAGERTTLVYPKPDFVPATYTILNFEVDDIDAAVDGLTERGVSFERYDDFDHDEKGIMRGRETGQGPDIAWFTDPAGNILAVMQTS
jgi:predicted enzyme related to lactoylglutathione lyase